MRKSWGLLLIGILVCSSFSCSGKTSNSPAGSGPVKTGTLAFTLEWKSPQPQPAGEGALAPQGDTLAPMSSNVCFDYGILQVNAKLFDSSSNPVVSATKLCAERGVRFEGIPAGSNYWIRFEGILFGGEVGWVGEKTGITVNAGATTDLGLIVMDYKGNHNTVPTVGQTSPLPGAVDVPVTSFVTAPFSEAMAPLSINTNTFSLNKGTIPVTGTVAYDNATWKATFYPSNNLDPGTDYTVTITTDVESMYGINMASNTQWTFTTESVCNSIPSSPTLISATAADGQVTTTWDPVSCATSYNLYWLTTQGVGKTNGTKIPDVKSPYGHTGLTNGTTYYYVVTAANSTGESGVSNEKSATPGTAPAAPTGLSPSAGDKQVTLIWNSVAGATSYNLYYATSSGVTKTTGTKISGVNSPYVHTGLTNGTTYYYVVTTVNGSLESGESGETSATPNPAPSAPTGLTAVIGNTQLTLSWNGVTGATSYNLYRSTAPGVTKTTGTKIASVTNPYTNTGLTNGTTYYYVVTAANSFGESAESGETSAIPGSFPAAPTGVTASPGNSQVTVVWNTVVGATSYNIYYSTSSTVSKATGTKVPNVTSPYTKTVLTNGTRYYFVVTATNSIGESPESAVVSAIPGSPPSAPTGVTATAGEGQVTLAWTPVSGATSYNLYFSTISGVNKGNGTKIASVTNPYTKTNLTNGTTYYFVVTALIGVLESTESVQVSATPKIWSGTKQFGTDGGDLGMSVAINITNGDVYLTGYVSGNFDGNISAGGADAFLIKFNKFGEKQWTRQFGTSGNDYGRGVAVDSGGNAYVVGDTFGGLDGNANAGANDIFLVKYNSAGVKQWTRQLGTSSNDYGYGVAADRSGNIYVTGSTYGGLDGNVYSGYYDMFIAKYNSSGIKQWTKQLGSSVYDYGNGVAVDSNGNAYVTGYTNGGLDGNTSAGQDDIYLVKYDSAGVKQWTRQLGAVGTACTDRSFAVAVDVSGNAYVTGETYCGLDGNTNAGTATTDIVLVKYSYFGVKQWTLQFGTSASDGGRGVVVDSAGNIYVVGYTNGSLDGNTNAGLFDAILVKYNSAGLKQWTRQVGTSGDDDGRGVTVDSNGNPYVVGYTNGGLNGNTNAGSNDIFLIKYNPSGVIQ